MLNGSHNSDFQLNLPGTVFPSVPSVMPGCPHQRFSCRHRLSSTHLPGFNFRVFVWFILVRTKGSESPDFFTKSCLLFFITVFFYFFEQPPNFFFKRMTFAGCVSVAFLAIFSPCLRFGLQITGCVSVKEQRINVRTGMTSVSGIGEPTDQAL